MSILTVAQKELLKQLLEQVSLQADRKQAVCDRHIDDEGSAAYTRLESQANRLYAKKAALKILMEEAGIK